jgi:hypothetical protein
MAGGAGENFAPSLRRRPALESVSIAIFYPASFCSHRAGQKLRDARWCYAPKKKPAGKAGFDFYL